MIKKWDKIGRNCRVIKLNVAHEMLNKENGINSWLEQLQNYKRDCKAQIVVFDETIAVEIQEILTKQRN